MAVLLNSFLILIVLASLTIGVFFMKKPGLAIEIQRRFYERINWRIAPISMAREIRNTRIMGLFVIIITALCILLLLLSG
ncbi:MAG: hypothetical protein DRP74_03220 [Candidatus Omnitrophota bacterium]|nr:MAG: hypothetical protein DRP74_03220 [Candidatus Omnitrophota bacterium]